LFHWGGDGAEGANFWTNGLGQLQARGLKDMRIACVEGLTGFKQALHAVFPKTRIQRCSVHQIRSSLKSVSYTDQDACIRDLKTVYQAATRDAAEKWRAKDAVAGRAWENNGADLSTFVDFP